MDITDLRPDDARAIQQAATILVDGFKEHWPRAWPDVAAGLREVHASFGGDRLSRIARDADGNVLGWIGGIRRYRGNVWEIHPLIVRTDCHDTGIGRALVTDLEAITRAQGARTLFVGTDDEDNQTTLSGADLYPRVWEHIARIQNLRGHPYEFYQKLGFTIVGVVPDANGAGKPDILMAKQLRQPKAQ